MNEAPWFDDVEPTWSGFARVWEIVEPPHALEDPRWQGNCGKPYLIFAPGAHPLWSWHVLTAIKLIDIEGLDPPIKHYPEAEYEIMVLALNPEHPAPDPRDFPEDVKYLTPPDIMQQFHGVTDEQAAEIVGLVAKSVAEGILIPDSDYRRFWDHAITATVNHYALGIH